MGYKRKWKPSKAASREFAANMKNEEFAKAYHERKAARAEKKRSTSRFDYATAGGNFVPTKAQHDFCFENMDLFVTSQEQDAAHQVMYGFSCSEKVPHDSIHIVNEKIRSQF